MKLKLSKLPFDFVANFLNARAPRERLLLVGFAVVLVFVVDYFLWLAPVSAALMRTIPSLSSTEAELDELKEDQKNQSAIKQKWGSVQKDLKDKENGIGGSSEIAPMLENLSKLASGSGVKITSLKPVENMNPAVSKLYFSVPIQLQATAGTHELGLFLMRLETGGTYFKVANLKISANSANERKHLIEMMVETYRKA